MKQTEIKKLIKTLYVDLGFERSNCRQYVHACLRFMDKQPWIGESGTKQYGNMIFKLTAQTNFPDYGSNEIYDCKSKYGFKNRDGKYCSGFYAISAEARMRWRSYPEKMNDPESVLALFELLSATCEKFNLNYKYDCDLSVIVESLKELGVEVEEVEQKELT